MKRVQAGFEGVDYSVDGKYSDHSLLMKQKVRDPGGEYSVETGRRFASTAAGAHENFLARAGEILSSSLDYEATVTTVARLVVPAHADWCAVDILHGDSVQRLAVAQTDPSKVRLAKETEKYWPILLGSEHGIGNVLRTGESELYPIVTEEMLVREAASPEHLLKMREIGFRSVIIVPLKIRRQVLGALTLVNSETDRSFNAEDLILAEELGRRAALAIENARLFKEAERCLPESQAESAFFKTLIEKASIGFAYINYRMEYVRVNRAFAELKGRVEEDYLGKRVGEVYPPHGTQIEPIVQKVLDTGQPVLDVEFSGEDPSRSGKIRHWLLNFYPVDSDSGVHGVGLVVNEITERKQVEEAFRHQALHDALTGLPNRKMLEESFVLSLDLARKSGESLAILFLDLDRFKNINDTLGHMVGDQILREVAIRLRRSIRKDDIVARMSGDEFYILLRDIKSAENVTKVAKKIMKAFVPEFKIDGYSLHVRASIGIAISPADGEDVATLLRNADSALYVAKAAGRGKHAFYNRTQHLNASEKFNLENFLRKAVEQGQLRVYYQPIVDIKSGNIISVEALVRWQHPQLGFVLPQEFIPLAEESGLIVEIGKWVLRKICKDFKALRRSGLSVPRIAINFSAREFLEANIARSVKEILAEADMDPRYLEIEITETVAMDDIYQTSSKLKDLEEMGVHITIDDFGTGYSSLSYLKKFPIKQIKIDKSFVRDCVRNPQDAAIVKAIVSMAQSLSLTVVGEGVESEEQLAYLASLGCDAVQGNLIGPASDFKKLEQWIRERASLFAASHWKVLQS